MEEKDRFYVSGFSKVYDLSKDKKLSFYAHWVWWSGKSFNVLPVGTPTKGGGLQKLTTKHPDQIFFNRKKLRARPNSSAAIVTDCRLLPCSRTYAGCAYRIPFLVSKTFGNDIPIACFGHSDFMKSKWGRFGFKTYSGADRISIDESLSEIFTWDWDEDSEAEDYLD